MPLGERLVTALKPLSHGHEIELKHTQPNYRVKQRRETQNELFKNALIAGLLLAATGPAAAERIVGRCSPTAIKFVASDGYNSTGDIGFVAIPGMALRFAQGGNRPSCIIVEIQGTGYAVASANRIVSLDARLDGNDADDYITGAQPEFMEGTNMFGVSNSLKFIWINVAPGQHTVKLYYRSANGGSVSMNRPTMILHHVP